MMSRAWTKAKSPWSRKSRSRRCLARRANGRAFDFRSCVGRELRAEGEDGVESRVKD